MLKKWLAATLVVIAAYSNVKPAYATLTVYYDVASFNAAVGGTNLENFNSLAPTAFVSPGGPSFSQPVGYFNIFGSGNGDYIGIANGSQAGNIDGSNFLSFGQSSPLGGNDYNGNGGEGPALGFSFGSQIIAFGFDWVDTDPTDSYSVKVNGTTFANPPFSSGTGRGFFGVVATEGERFVGVNFTQNASGGVIDQFGIDNVRWTGVYPVPEPSTIALLCSGTPLGLVAWRHRRNSK